MIDLLIDLGISQKEIEIILRENTEFIYYDLDRALKNINILKSISCSDKSINRIIYTNSYFLNRNSDDIILLIERLEQLGFINIKRLFEENPCFLDKYSYEVDCFISKKMEDNNLSLKEVVDLIECNSYMMDEE